MAKGEFCKIDNLKPSQRTTEYIDQINHIVDMSTVLDKILMAVPFFQIFAGRESYKGVALASASYNATTYDWTLYYEAVASVDSIKRGRLEQIALKASLETHGEERKFWECVYNAL